MKRAIAIIALLLATAIGGTLGKESVRALLPKKPDPRSLAFLSTIAGKLNEGLPMMVDRETEVMSVEALEGVLLYNYRLIAVSVEEFDAKHFAEVLRPSAIATNCTNPKVREPILDNLITMRYVYLDASRRYVTSFDITSEDCG